MIKIRRAEEKDILFITEIIQQAKDYFVQNGIPQWQTRGYPDASDVRKDIHNQGAYVAVDENIVCGYCFICAMKDRNYNFIEGKWLNDLPYVVMHRICIRREDKGKRIASMFVATAEQMGNNLRADTHEKNRSMRKMLENNGFTKCGTIYVEDGTPRVAYQKVKERN